MSALPEFIMRTQPKSFEGCTPLSEDERLAEFKFKYYAAGCHHVDAYPNDHDDETEDMG